MDAANKLASSAQPPIRSWIVAGGSVAIAGLAIGMLATGDGASVRGRLSSRDWDDLKAFAQEEGALEAIRAELRARDTPLKRKIIEAWSLLPDQVTALERIRPKPQHEVWDGCWMVLHSMAPEVATKALPEVIGLMEPDLPQSVRHYAIGALQWLGWDSAEAVEALLRIVNDPDPGVAGEALWMTSQLGEAGRKGLPVALDLLRAEPGTGAVYLRQSALLAISEWGVSSEAVPLVVRALQDSALEREAALALCTGGSEMALAIPELIRILRRERTKSEADRQRGMRTVSAALQIMIAHGPGSAEAGDEAARWTDDPSRTTSLLARLAAARITGDAASGWLAISEALSVPGVDRDGHVFHVVTGAHIYFNAQEAALWYLPQFGKSKSEALGLARDLLGNQGNVAGALAARAVWLMGGSAEEVLPVLLAALQAPPLNGGGRLLAIRTLEGMGDSAAPVLPRLEQVEREWRASPSANPSAPRLRRTVGHIRNCSKVGNQAEL